MMMDDYLAEPHTIQETLRQFERKYGQTWEEFSRELHNSPDEDFEREDDYIEWTAYTKIANNSNVRNSTNSLIIFEAALDELDPFIDLLDETGAWLWDKGVKQWEVDRHRQGQDELQARIKQGYLILATKNGRLAGGCILSDMSMPVWKEIPDDAMYISSLAVARFAAGQDVGGKILAFCTNIVRRQKHTRLRLDCWEGNTFLKTYYRDRGFQQLMAVPENDYFCRLFEKTIKPPILNP